MSESVLCYCDSELSFATCCEPHLKGRAAPTPVALMRSRYCAFVLADMDYLAKSMRPPASVNFDVESTKEWTQSVQWQGLKVLEHGLRMGDQQGMVEFVAHYMEHGKAAVMHERSIFKRHKSRWYYVSSRPVRHAL